MKRGDRVVVVVPHMPEWYFAILGMSKLGTRDSEEKRKERGKKKEKKGKAERKQRGLNLNIGAVYIPTTVMSTPKDIEYPPNHFFSFLK